MKLVDGDVVLLAGATGRVGGATLTTLIREGARVAVISRDQARAATTIVSVLEPGEIANTLALEADLSDPDSAAAAVAACVTTFGRIDAVINLAGNGPQRVPLVNSKLADVQQSLAGYTETAYNLAIPALRAMLAQPFRDGTLSRGRIVTVTAGSSKSPAPGRGTFAVAKAGVNALMLAIAREHKTDGIVANALVLGGVAFPGRQGSPDDIKAAATPQEVADVLTFLASDRSSGINGELVDLNAREID
jgi:NAD(P)-dependent dehydrogenase (short-subunit alcohol dehydrogenase family)